MPSTGLSNPLDYLLGRGRLYFASVDANGFPKEWRDLGNCPDFTVTVESENLEHQSSRQGLKTTDRDVIISQSMSLAFSLEELNLDNLALFLAGTTTTRAQANTPIVGTNNVVVSGKGRWYDLYDVAAPASYPPPNTANRVYKIANVTVSAGGGGAAFVEGTDYTVDHNMGRIFIPVGSSIGATDSLDVDFTPASMTIEEVQTLKTTKLTGALKFISVNPNNGDAEREYQFHAVTLRADGDLALIGDEFAQMPFSGSAEAREAVDPDNPTCRIIDFDQS